MSNEESKFIRQLKITLIAALGPFMIATVGLLINDHFKIQNNEKHIEVVENSTVRRELMVAYLDEIRNLVAANRALIDNHCVETDNEIDKINQRLDDLMREIYNVKTRGAVKKDDT